MGAAPAGRLTEPQLRLLRWLVMLAICEALIAVWIEVPSP